MAVIIVDDPKDNFWQKNPTIQYISPFAEFKKDLGSRFSSRIMSAIYLIYDPKSNLRNSGMSEDEIITDVNINFLNKKNFEWEKYENLIESYRKKLLNKEEKLLLDLEEELERRTIFLKDWTWDKDTAQQKNSLMTSSKKLFDDYLELKEKVRQEQASEKYRGDYVPSLIENQG